MTNERLVAREWRTDDRPRVARRRRTRTREVGDSELKIMGIECSAKFMREFIAGLLSVLAFTFFEV